MSKWIDFSLDERKAMIQGVVEARQIDEAAAEKDWWVTAVLYALFHTSVSEYLLFKGGTSLSKGWDIINRFSEDIDLALSRDYFLNVKQLSCASCTSNTQIHNLREKGQNFLFGEFKEIEINLRKRYETMSLWYKLGKTGLFLFVRVRTPKVEWGNPLYALMCLCYSGRP